MNLWAASAVARSRLDDLRREASRRAGVGSILTGHRRKPARLRYRIRHSIGRSLVEAGLHLLVGPSVH